MTRDGPHPLRFVALFLVLGMTTACPQKSEGETTPLKEGQVWKYETRSGEESSRVVIIKIEENENTGTIVHVAIDNIRIRNPAEPTGWKYKIGHLPVDERALRKSLVAPDGQDFRPRDMTGYTKWKEAFQQGKAGVWSLSLADSLQTLENTYTR